MVKKLILVVLIYCISANLSAQTNQERCNQGNALYKIINKYHYQPKDINDQFTKSVIRDILQALDPQALYFIQDDSTEILLERDKLKDYLQNTSCSFLNLISELYKIRLIEADTLISQILSTPLKLNEKDSISFLDYKDLHFASSSITLRTKWEKWLKFETLKQLYNQAKDDSLLFSKNDEIALSEVPETMEKVKVREKKNIKKIQYKPEGFENYVCSVILNAIAQNFDPHTSFFSKTEKENFDNLLSKKSDSFGFEIKVIKSGVFVIDKIKPGSPAWKSNKLQKGDYLLEAIAKDRPSLDFTNTDIYEATDYMLSSDVKTIELKVKHSNGKIENIQLTKEKLTVEQNQLNSFILKGKKKIGYIALPDFYVGEDQRSLGCSNDVAKEMIKLLKENIDGLIIDIRYNGGGDLNEANELSGLFIDEGPLSIMADRFSKPKIIKDVFRGTIYNGPILVMVNGQSASASEVFAGTLQDYNRAVIFGSRTFGKATAQVVLPIDTSFDISKKSSQPNIDMGFIKLTVNKLYRVTCASHQRIGVVPDIQIPFIYDKISEKEDDFKNALPNDKVSKNVVYKKYPPLPIQHLKDKSLNRVKSNKLFNEIYKSSNDIVDNEFLVKGIALQIDDFKHSILKVHKIIDQFQKLTENPTSAYTVDCKSTNNELIQKDKYFAEIIAEEKESIQKDIYIDEAFNIINDLIDYQDKKPAVK